jgi:hypothetical protein
MYRQSVYFGLHDVERWLVYILRNYFRFWLFGVLRKLLP